MTGGAVTVTGLGIAAPTGLGVRRYWSNTVAGRSGLRRLERIDGARYATPVAGQITDFDDGLVPERLHPQTDRSTRLCLVASDWARQDAQLADSGDDFAVGTVLSCAIGGFEFGQGELQKLWRTGSQHVSGYQSFAWFYAVNTGQTSIRHGLRGSSTVLVSDQAGGLDSIGQARRQLLAGDAAAVLAGGIEANLCPWGLTAQATAGEFSGDGDPARAFRPFDIQAAGNVPGEGGAVLVVEPARAGGYADVIGWGASFDGDDEAPGRGLARAATAALRDAGLPAAAVDVVFADASGLPAADAAERSAITELFPAGVPVTAPKAGTGRLQAGGAALDAACAALALRDQVIPPTPLVQRPLPGLDLVINTARRQRLGHALVLARGRGGFNSALLLRAP